MARKMEIEEKKLYIESIVLRSDGVIVCDNSFGFVGQVIINIPAKEDIIYSEICCEHQVRLKNIGKVYLLKLLMCLFSIFLFLV